MGMFYRPAGHPCRRPVPCQGYHIRWGDRRCTGRPTTSKMLWCCRQMLGGPNPQGEAFLDYLRRTTSATAIKLLLGLPFAVEMIGRSIHRFYGNCVRQSECAKSKSDRALGSCALMYRDMQWFRAVHNIASRASRMKGDLHARVGVQRHGDYWPEKFHGVDWKARCSDRKAWKLFEQRS